MNKRLNSSGAAPIGKVDGVAHRSTRNSRLCRADETVAFRSDQHFSLTLDVGSHLTQASRAQATLRCSAAPLRILRAPCAPTARLRGDSRQYAEKCGMPISWLDCLTRAVAGDF